MENSPASPTNGGYVQVMASIAGKSDQYQLVSNENLKFKIRKHPCVNCTERSGIVWMCLLWNSSQAGRSAAIWVIFLTLQEQLSSLNVKANHCSASLVGTLSRVVTTHAYEPFFSLWCLGRNAVHVRIYVYVKFSKRKCRSEEWCYANDVSYGIIVLLFQQKP